MTNGASSTCLCTVNNAGASAVTVDDDRGQGGAGPNIVTITLTDNQENWFANQLFASAGMQDEMLATALTAITTGCQAAALVDLPPYHDFVVPSCYAIWVIAAGSPAPV